MPRRVFDPRYGDHATAQQWQWLTNLSAIGGIVLFASALFFVLVMLFTLYGPRVPEQRLEFAEPLEDPGPRGAWLDRLGLLTAVAVVLIVIAYGYPIWQHLQMPRFGSPGFSPF
jgi:cytochrome c oxidase subunit 1